MVNMASKESSLITFVFLLWGHASNHNVKHLSLKICTTTTNYLAEVAILLREREK